MKDTSKLIIILDSLGWDICEEYKFLSDIFKYRKPLRTILGYSSAAIPSLLTGASPQEHGRWTIFYRRNGGIVRYLSYQLKQKLRDFPIAKGCLFIRKEIEKDLINFFGNKWFRSIYAIPISYLNKFDSCEWNSPFLNNCFKKGSIVDDLIKKGYQVEVLSFPLKDVDIFKEAYRKIKKRRSAKPWLLLTYCGEIDKYLHIHRSNPKKLKIFLNLYEDYIKKIVNIFKKRYGNEQDIWIISDHGMTPVYCCVNILGALKKQFINRNELFFCDSTMIRFWWNNDVRFEDSLKRLVNSYNCGKWLSKKVLKEEEINFKNRKYGDDIFIANPGVLFVPSFFGAKHYNGMHGYDPEETTTHAMILSNNPIGIEVESILDFRKETNKTIIHG